MRRRLGCLVLIAIVAILLAAAWLMYGQKVRTFYVLKRCDWAWSRVGDYQSEFELRTELGPFTIPVQGTIWFKKPDMYRVDLGPDELTACRVMAHGDRTWVYMPLLGMALDVTFKQGDPADVVRSQSPAQWVDQLEESTDARVTGTDVVEGRECYVVELTPSPETKAASTPLAPPEAGALLDPQMLMGRWERTRVYVSKKTALPVQGVALTDKGNPIITWTAKSLAVNQGLSSQYFEFDPPKDVTVIEREFDPAHPESLLLPPGELGKSPSWDELLEALEGETDEQLKDLWKPGKSTERSLDEFLKGLKNRLREQAAHEEEKAPSTAPGPGQ
jgi:outer membrane lipoprotein-sorting protein